MGGGEGGLKRTGKITLPSSFPSSNWPAGHSFLSTFFDVQRRLAPRRSWSTTNVPTPCLHPSISIPRTAPSGISPQILSPAASPSTPSRSPLCLFSHLFCSIPLHRMLFLSLPSPCFRRLGTSWFTSCFPIRGSSCCRMLFRNLQGDSAALPPLSVSLWSQLGGSSTYCNHPSLTVPEGFQAPLVA